MATLYKMIYFVILFVIGINLGKAEFSRQHVEVYVNQPLPPKNATSETKPGDLIPMLSLVSTKFSKIATIIMDNPEDISNELIPKAVATYNKFHLKAVEWPLELSVSFVMSEVQTESSLAGWNSLKKLLDEANHIYPGTVKRIYFQHLNLKADPEMEDEDGTFEKFLNYLAKANLQIGKEYELGATLPIDASPTRTLSPVLQHIRHISFAIWPKKLDMVNGLKPLKAAENFAEYQSAYDKQFTAEYGKDVSFRFQTGWPNFVDKNEATRDNELVEYWNAVNEVVVRRNCAVVFWQAFDVPEKVRKSEVSEHTGLWRLVPNENYKRILDYDFVEKTASPSRGFIATFLLVSGILLVVLVILIAVLALVLLIIRRFYPDLFYARVTPYLFNIKWLQNNNRWNSFLSSL